LVERQEKERQQREAEERRQRDERQRQQREANQRWQSDEREAEERQQREAEERRQREGIEEPLRRYCQEREAEESDQQSDEAADLFLTDIIELQAQAVAALRDAPTTDWPELWGALKNALRENIEALREVFVEIVAAAGGSEAGTNLMLLQEWHGLGAEELPKALRPLCKGLTIPELEQLASSDLPLAWKVEALTAALGQPLTQPAAARLLMDKGDEKLLSAFWAPIADRPAQDQLRFLGLLMPGKAARLPEWLSRLLKSKARVRPEALDAFLGARGLAEEKWDEFWQRDGNFVYLLRMLPAWREASAPIWARFTDRLGRGALEGNGTQKALLELLKNAVDSFGAAVPAAAREAVRDWELLRQHFKWPPGDANAWREAYKAWRRRSQRPEELFQSYFRRFVVPRGARAQVVEPFVDALLNLLPRGDCVAEHRQRLRYWLKVVEACADPVARKDYQVYYLEHFVPAQHRSALTEEARSALASGAD
jgi:hypothetical protein